MIKSMTGFGQSLFDDGQVQICVEIRALNSKFFDLNVRLPKAFSEKEIELRNLLSDRLERGKISIIIDHIKTGEDSTRQTYNAELFQAYYDELHRLAKKVKADVTGLFQLALESPEVIQSKVREEVTEVEWNKLKNCVLEATMKCDQFREKEGKVLEEMMSGCIQAISNGLEEVSSLDPLRIERIREKLTNNVKAFFGEAGFDPNRLEQEIIYYVEKFDINEEKIRLRAHLDHFLEVLHAPRSNGKKLSFISQEIGREINTIGSKANDANIQKVVVSMKEELEKIKEQLGNVL